MALNPAKNTKTNNNLLTNPSNSFKELATPQTIKKKNAIPSTNIPINGTNNNELFIISLTHNGIQLKDKTKSSKNKINITGFCLLEPLTQSLMKFLNELLLI